MARWSRRVAKQKGGEAEGEDDEAGLRLILVFTLSDCKKNCNSTGASDLDACIYPSSLECLSSRVDCPPSATSPP